MPKRILYLVALAAIMSGRAAAADPKQKPTARLEEFYVVSDGELDSDPLWQLDLLEVEPEGGSVRVRYTKIEAATMPCADTAIQGSTAIIPNVGPADLTSGIDLCTLDPEKFNQTVAAHVRKRREFFSSRSAVVARCGTEQRVFRLPEFQMDMPALKHTAPAAQPMTKLLEYILARAFPKQSDSGPTLDLQPDAPQINELKAGRFDPGTWFVADYGDPPGIYAQIGPGNLDPTFGSFSDVVRLHNVLGRYKHPARSLTGKVVLVSIEGFKLSQYVQPQYPKLALQAQIQGRAELSLHVDPATGNIEAVDVVSGHPMLTPAAAESMSRWQFDTSLPLPKTIRAVVDFSNECE